MKDSFEEARITESRVATVIKVIDRCNNISTMATAFSRKKMVDYIDETEAFILPLLHILKERYPEHLNHAFLIEYQMCSLLESLKRTI